MARVAADKFADLRIRLVSALAAAAVAFILVWLGGIWTLILAIVAAVAMLIELWAITNHGRGRDGSLCLTLGGGYILMAAFAFVWLRGVEPYGFLSIIWAAFVVVAADVGGYFAGRVFGGPKLWTRISPKKTWSGLIGGLFLAALVGLVFSGATAGTYYWEVCTVSALAALLSVAGDLGESALKRHFGVKDAGRTMPGHGGLLDRLDGHMAAILVAAAVTWWRAQPVFIW